MTPRINWLRLDDTSIWGAAAFAGAGALEAVCPGRSRVANAKTIAAVTTNLRIGTFYSRSCRKVAVATFAAASFSGVYSQRRCRPPSSAVPEGRKIRRVLVLCRCLFDVVDDQLIHHR